MMYRLHEGTPLTESLISRLIEFARPELMRRCHLFDYYMAKHNILGRTFNDINKPNNRVVSPYARYITDVATGYFVGEPISYKSDDPDLIETINDTMKYNNAAACDMDNAKNCSICGVSYELEWIDKDGSYRFSSLDPRECFAVYDTNLEPEMLYFIRSYRDYDYTNNAFIEYVEVYSRYDYRLYKRTVATLDLVEMRAHSFGCVPAIEYLNNKEMLGDFEAEITLIDAYDTLISNSVNDSNEFSDAYLVLTGMSGTTAEDVAAMKTNRVLLMGDDSKAEWLTKNINSTYQEDMKTRLDNEIHKFSGVPNLTDENFAQNSSGVAIRYKLLGLENITSKKEASFRKGISRRLEIMCDYLKLLGADANYLNIEIVFTRNIPTNLAEIAGVLNQIGHLLSEETQLSLLPIDVDYEMEQERKRLEKEEGYDDQYLLGTESQTKRSESSEISE